MENLSDIGLAPYFDAPTDLLITACMWLPAVDSTRATRVAKTRKHLHEVIDDSSARHHWLTKFKYVFWSSVKDPPLVGYVSSDATHAFGANNHHGTSAMKLIYKASPITEASLILEGTAYAILSDRRALASRRRERTKSN